MLRKEEFLILDRGVRVLHLNFISQMNMLSVSRQTKRMLNNILFINLSTFPGICVLNVIHAESSTADLDLGFGFLGGCGGMPGR